MKQVVLLVILALSAVVNCQDPPPSHQTARKVEAGIILNLGQTFFDEYKKEAVERFMAEFEDLDLPDVNREDEFAFGISAATSISNIDIANITFDPVLTDIQLSESRPQLNLKLVDIGLYLTFDYQIITEPQLVDEWGYGKGVIEGLNIFVKANPGVQNGRFQIEFEHLELEVDDFNLELEGGDMAVLLNYLSDYIFSIIRESLIGVLQEQTIRSIEEVINYHIKNTIPDADFPSYQLELDMALTEEGVVITDDWIAIPVEGTFHPDTKSDPRDQEFVEMPLHRSDGNIVQVLFSEYSLTSILQSAVSLDWYNYTLTQSSDNVDAIIADFEFSFGEHSDCEMFVKPVLVYEREETFVKIDDEGSEIELVVEIHYKNPFNKDIDVALVVAKVNADIRFFVREDFKLYGTVEDLKLKVLDFKPYYVTTTTSKQIMNKISLLGPFMASYANNLLDQGMQLPVPVNIVNHIQNPSVIAFDKYLMIDGQPDFDEEEASSLKQQLKAPKNTGREKGIKSWLQSLKKKLIRE